MEDNKRMVLGFVLILFIMIMFQFLTVSRQKKVPESSGETVIQEARTEVEKEIPDNKGIESIPIEEKGLNEIFAKSDTTKDQEKKINRMVIIETNLMKAHLSPTGGTIDSIYLKDYAVTLKALNQDARLLSTVMLKGSARFSTDVIPFNVEVEERGKDKIVIFSYLYDSLEITKTYLFQDDSYLIRLECLPQLEYYYKISSFETGEAFPREARYSGTVYSVGKRPQNINKKDMFKGENKDITGTIDWVGYETKYFFIGLVPEDYVTEFTVNKSPDNPSIFVRAEPNARFYFGPLKYTVLSKAKEGLEDAIYFGWGFIRPISKLLYHFLNFVQRSVHNFGVVIIIFAIAIVLVFSPITLTSFRSMNKMQALQPKMQELREKYKKDPQRMNKETMQLYKEFGVNPLSSCLPMLLQFPIFFALYSVLNSSIELKGAPFILWIEDLSMKDPYYVLPILMGISMFLQQRLFSPQQGSEQQKMLTFLMPIILTFVFLSFPSGLTLYWLTYNILTISVQSYLRKKT
ncbi:membrane protein insertase YidC [candidate division WOR-3 bacterium]|nr:membrane protein insertase YidC [candidate division WOR-3 bacterium]